MAYFVLMIDLKDSRKMDEGARRANQARLKGAKNAVNQFLAGKARLEFSSGDSLQAFAKDAALALRICLLLVYLMHPTPLHCGIGTGDIYVIDEDEGTNANDGPAYHDALRSIERSKKDMREVIVHFGTAADELINSLMLAAHLLKEANTNHQNMYVMLVCLLTLSGGDEGIMRLCLENADFPAAKRPLRSEELAGKRNIAEFVAFLSQTSRQNGYGMLKKSNALSIVELYDTCLNYLTTT